MNIIAWKFLKIEPESDKENKMTRAPNMRTRPILSVFADLMLLHAESEDWSDWANVQAELSFRWAH